MAVAEAQNTQWAGSLEPSPAGPIDEAEAATLAKAPAAPLPRPLQVLRFSQRQIEVMFRHRRRLGPVFRVKGVIPGDPTVTSHPDHVKSLFTAKPGLAPSLTGESPLRPILGSNSVLTSVGDRHMRQRKLLLPPFHGEAVARYVAMIDEVIEREIDRWPVNEPMALAPRMQAVTLDVIMRGIFGVEGDPPAGSPEAQLRDATRKLTEMSTWKVAQLGELANLGRTEPVGLTKMAMRMIDRPTFAVIAERRRASDLEERTDIMSVLMRARTEDGEALSDQELRDELLTLVLAGHETTANQLAWTWERLVRWPEALERLTEAVRTDHGADDVVEQTINESMRSRPVIPIIGRRVTVPWRLGEFAVDAGDPISMSILLVHHREDIYPDPFSFRPERWEGIKPDTYRWIPFGGGVRRCLGATLAMAEQRAVLKAMARRLDIEAAEPEPERALHRNVTMIPAHGGRVVIRASRP
jgi:cytochrome P450